MQTAGVQCSSSRGFLRMTRSIGSSFRLFEHPLMPAAWDFAVRSDTVVFVGVTRSCSDAPPSDAGLLPPPSGMTVSAMLACAAAAC